MRVLSGIDVPTPIVYGKGRMRRVGDASVEPGGKRKRGLAYGCNGEAELTRVGDDALGIGRREGEPLGG